MEFYNILFPSPSQEAKAGDCPWLRGRSRRVRAGRGCVTRGNKTFPIDKDNLTEAGEIPAFFADIGLDQLTGAILPGAEDDPLRRVYQALSTDAETVLYRQAILRALESEDVLSLFETFCRGVENAARTIADGRKVHAQAQRDKYVVDGAVAYCDAVRSLLAAASAREVPSHGLASFVEAVRAYAAGPVFRQTEALARQAKDEVEQIAFRLRLEKGRVLVESWEQGEDFVRETQTDFGRTEEDAAAETAPRDIRLFGQLELCPLGILIAEALQSRHPAAFKRLHAAAGAAGDIPEPFVVSFTREIRFYTSYRTFMREIGAGGLPFAYPVLSRDEAIRIDGAYDASLALTQTGVVLNGFQLSPAERGAVVTGANHSGKTTYLRALGQIAVLAALGLPAPCEYAEIPLFRRFFSHFSAEEEGVARQGRLKEELARLKPVLAGAGAGSLVLLNEMFSSTTAQDAQTMAGQVLGELVGSGARVLCVTHVAGPVPEGMVSMVAQVAPSSHERLYRIVRAPAETHAYVDGLIAKYRLSYQDVKERIARDV